MSTQTPEKAAAAHLRLQLHHALPQVSALGQGLGLPQTHAHQLVLQLAQDQLPRGLLPAAPAGQVGLPREAGGQPGLLTHGGWPTSWVHGCFLSTGERLTCQVSESSCSCSFSSLAEATAWPSRTLSALSSSCSWATLFSSGRELFL